VKNAATGQSVQAVVVDFDQPSSSNNLADVSQAVIDSLWPGYINGDLVNGYPLYAEIEYTGQFVPGMDYASGGDVGGAYTPSIETTVSPSVSEGKSSYIAAPVAEVPAVETYSYEPLVSDEAAPEANVEPKYVGVTGATAKVPAHYFGVDDKMSKARNARVAAAYETEDEAVPVVYTADVATSAHSNITQKTLESPPSNAEVAPTTESSAGVYAGIQSSQSSGSSRACIVSALATLTTLLLLVLC
jgi:hypothetical protein